MTDFKAKIHQIRFRQGLHPRPRWGAYSALPDPLAGFGGRFAVGEGLGWGRGGKGEGKGREGEVEGRERAGPQVTVEPGPLRTLLCHCLLVRLHPFIFPWAVGSSPLQFLALA